MIQNIDRQIRRKINRAITIVNFDPTDVSIAQIRFIGNRSDNVTWSNIITSTNFNPISLHRSVLATLTLGTIFFPIGLSRLQGVQHQWFVTLSQNAQRSSKLLNRQLRFSLHFGDHGLEKLNLVTLQSLCDFCLELIDTKSVNLFQ